MQCRHCKKLKGSPHHRGLCYLCRTDAAIRDLYPSTMKVQRGKNGTRHDPRVGYVYVGGPGERYVTRGGIELLAVTPETNLETAAERYWRVEEHASRILAHSCRVGVSGVIGEHDNAGKRGRTYTSVCVVCSDVFTATQSSGTGRRRTCSTRCAYQLGRSRQGQGRRRKLRYG